MVVPARRPRARSRLPIGRLRPVAIDSLNSPRADQHAYVSALLHHTAGCVPARPRRHPSIAREFG
jgi:hypothetical protein